MCLLAATIAAFGSRLWKSNRAFLILVRSWSHEKHQKVMMNSGFAIQELKHSLNMSFGQSACCGLERSYDIPPARLFLAVPRSFRGWTASRLQEASQHNGRSRKLTMESWSVQSMVIGMRVSIWTSIWRLDLVFYIFWTPRTCIGLWNSRSSESPSHPRNHDDCFRECNKRMCASHCLVS